MSKKILSFVLAVAMIFSVFAFSSSAALSEGQVGLKIVTSAKVGDPTGTPVTVDIYYTFPESLDLSTYTHSLGNLCLAFTDAFQINSANVGTQNCGKDALIIGESYTEVFKPDFTVNDLPTQWTNISAKFNSDDTAKGWDDAILVVPTYLSGGSYNAKTGYPIVADAPICTIKFVTTRTVTADDSFGIPSGTLGNLSKVQYYNGTKSVAYDTANIIMTEATGYANAAAPADPLVYSIGGKNDEVGVKKANDDGATYNIGTFFAFKTTDIAPAFNEKGTSANITGITATVVANTSSGGSASIDAETIKYVYDVSAAKDKSELGFIVAINNIPNDNKVPDSDDTVVSYTITPTVTTNSGDFVGETITVVVADL